MEIIYISFTITLFYDCPLVKGNIVLMTFAFPCSWVDLEACDIRLSNVEKKYDWLKDFWKGSSVPLCFFSL